jgi:hypothetical protein
LAQQKRWKSAAVQGLTGREAGKLLFGMQIPPSFEAVIEHARAPRGLIATRVAAKSEAR